MKSLSDLTKFTFTKYDTTKGSPKFNSDTLYFLDNYSIFIQKSFVSKIIVHVKIESLELQLSNSDHIGLKVDFFAGDLQTKEPLVFKNNVSNFLVLPADPNNFLIKQEDDFQFKNLSEDFQSNVWFFYCAFAGNRLPNSITLSFKIFSLK